MTFGPWLRKYGAWILASALAVVGFLFGISIRKRPVVVSPDPDKKRVEEQTARLEEAAETTAQAEKMEATRDYAGALQRALAEQASRSKTLLEEPPELTEYLKQTGRDIRGS